MGGFFSSTISEFSKLTSGLPNFLNPNPPPGGITNMRAPIAIKAAEGKQSSLNIKLSKSREMQLVLFVRTD